ncbi:M23 family metallopeptidase [Streptomyces himalayensis]|uniref:Peptidoglycan DD-metalloendopeptidase family protein n=1 Tax=Streptomyces himalayensis subsp. himalayensis TaxID=2756131 RepID=A0A7W0IDS5_9ACTN|nr:LysM peptidoglycan-binding domain-containing M23 family metallopeptidase [Streptomyces himalayensis]MBA2951336.1 peptidoglycan DD-metalloendopeptidase family protein [Streptomyces himalayensis subsp. himalayensis]
MPATGKNRRSKSLRFTRSIAAFSAGSAALALPLIGATGAFAAPAQTAPQSAVQSVSGKAVVAPAAKSAATKTYTVKSGDCLASIAREQKVAGGWKKLYKDNRKAIGADPTKIRAGLKLVVDGKAAATNDSASASASKAPAAAASKAPAEKASTTSTAPKATTTATSTAPADTAATTTSAFTAPIPGATMSTPYRQSGSMWSSGYHTGVDFVAPTGTSLKAVGAGTVVSAGWAGSYGNQVVIQLSDGLYAQYAHLSALSVSAGQTVTAGQQIGLSGSTGNSTGPHLHFEIRTTPDYGSDVDPLAYLRQHGVSI